MSWQVELKLQRTPEISPAREDPVATEALVASAFQQTAEKKKKKKVSTCFLCFPVMFMQTSAILVSNRIWRVGAGGCSCQLVKIHMENNFLQALKTS